MVGEWNLVANILIVVLPTIIGAITTKYVIKNWQIKKEQFEFEKEQFELRKQILIDFQKSFQSESTLSTEFVEMMCFRYVEKFEIQSKEKKEVIFHFTEKFNDGEFPKNVFNEEFKTFLKKLSVLEHERNNFLNTVKVYYDRKLIQPIVTDSTSQWDFVIKLVHAMYFAKTIEDFHKSYNIWTVASQDLDTKISIVAEFLSLNPLLARSTK